jgi:hypothetical protein
MIFARRFRSAGHTRGFSVERDALVGWAVREEEDDRVVRMTRCRDWHRVESLMTLFQIKASALQQDGWQEVTPT